MPHLDKPWERQKAKKLVCEFLNNDLVPDEIIEDVSTHLEAGDPMQALEEILNAR